MEERERLYDFICEHPGLTKDEIRKALGMKDSAVRDHLNALYKAGFVNWERGKYHAAKEDEVFKLYLERNVDFDHLKETVDLKLVESLMKQRSGKDERARRDSNPRFSA